MELKYLKNLSSRFDLKELYKKAKNPRHKYQDKREAGSSDPICDSSKPSTTDTTKRDVPLFAVDKTPDDVRLSERANKKNKTLRKVALQHQTGSPSEHQQQERQKVLQTVLQGACAQDPLLKKAVVTADFEKKHTVPPYQQSLAVEKKQRKEERSKTKGPDWFNLAAPEVTDEQRRDLELLQMRNALDTKRSYKKPSKNPPKYFQVGRVVDAPNDFYSARIVRKDRRQTLLEELLANAKFARLTKIRHQRVLHEQRFTNVKARRALREQSKAQKKRRKASSKRKDDDDDDY